MGLVSGVWLAGCLRDSICDLVSVYSGCPGCCSPGGCDARQTGSSCKGLFCTLQYHSCLFVYSTAAVLFARHPGNMVDAGAICVCHRCNSVWGREVAERTPGCPRSVVE